MIYIRGLLNQFIKLAEILEINKTTKNLTKAIESLKPSIFWKDKPMVLGQANKQLGGSWRLPTRKELENLVK